MKITDKEFFCVPVLELAEKLLGKILVRATEKGTIIKQRITEVEAYNDETDSASHASKGLTKRTAPMFERGGTVYVYLCYGIYDILNIVSGQKGEAGGVMIRGVCDTSDPTRSVVGPGRASRALEITRALNFQDLTKSKKIWLEDDGFAINPQSIQKLARIGISYARPEDQAKLWRFKI